VSHIQDVKDLPQHLRAELKHFFESYKQLENKKVIVDEFLSKEKAEAILQDSIKLYNETYRKK
jgi:inorganic pyrophosphatase